MFETLLAEYRAEAAYYRQLSESFVQPAKQRYAAVAEAIERMADKLESAIKTQNHRPDVG